MLQIPHHLLQRHPCRDVPLPAGPIDRYGLFLLALRRAKGIRGRVDSVEVDAGRCFVDGVERGAGRDARVVEGHDVAAAGGGEVVDDGAEAGFVDADGHVHHQFHQRGSVFQGGRFERRFGGEAGGGGEGGRGGFGAEDVGFRVDG